MWTPTDLTRHPALPAQSQPEPFSAQLTRAWLAAHQADPERWPARTRGLTAADVEALLGAGTGSLRRQASSERPLARPALPPPPAATSPPRRKRPRRAPAEPAPGATLLSPAALAERWGSPETRSTRSSNAASCRRSRSAAASAFPCQRSRSHRERSAPMPRRARGYWLEQRASVWRVAWTENRRKRPEALAREIKARRKPG